MKFYETHFEEYINENNRLNLHPKLGKLYEKFIESMKPVEGHYNPVRLSSLDAAKLVVEQLLSEHKA